MNGAGGIDPTLRSEIAAWITDDPDPVTRGELDALVMEKDVDELRRRFDHPLRFGTAGLRGTIGAGPARMNRLVVRRTTAGLCRWLSGRRDDGAGGVIVVGRDARTMSDEFADEVAGVAADHGVAVLRFDRALPTPITAFATRALGADVGVMITASHNPAADNGYKVYLSDGAQVFPPYDGEIEDAARLESSGAADVVEGTRLRASVTSIDEGEILANYTSTVAALVEPGGPRQLRTVYTPLHGVGGTVLPDLLVAMGFAPATLVAEQSMPDAAFPTVAFPNPEEAGALDLAIATAQAIGADLVLANDPDADRLAVAVPDGRGGFRPLTGDELGVLIADRLISTSTGDDRLVASTIVSSSMLEALATARGVEYVATLTGFKWLARAAATRPGHRLLFAYEEARGYAVSDAIADKDGMSAAIVVAAFAAELLANASSLTERLDDLYEELGVHLTSQWSLRLDGSNAAASMAGIVDRWRTSPPATLGGISVTSHRDLLSGLEGLPPTDAIVVRAGDGVRVVIRPSGTEPKLKAYLEVRTPPPGADRLAEARAGAERLLEVVRDDVVAACM